MLRENSFADFGKSKWLDEKIDKNPLWFLLLPWILSFCLLHRFNLCVAFGACSLLLKSLHVLCFFIFQILLVMFFPCILPFYFATWSALLVLLVLFLCLCILFAPVSLWLNWPYDSVSLKLTLVSSTNLTARYTASLVHRKWNVFNKFRGKYPFFGHPLSPTCLCRTDKAAQLQRINRNQFCKLQSLWERKKCLSVKRVGRVSNQH